MTNLIKKREFLAAGVGIGVGLSLGTPSAVGQDAPAAAAPGRGGRGGRQVAHRMAKTTLLFKSPPGYPNAIAVAPEGLWIGEQKLSGPSAASYKLPEPTDLHEAAWLVDWNGKLLKTVMTESRNTSGMAYGDGYIWMCANEAPEGVFQTDMNSRTVSHRQIPLGPPDNGGGCHGALYQDGKLWLAALRLRGMLRVDPKTWEPEFLIPVDLPEDRSRLHAIAWDNGAIWIVIGNNSRSFAEGKPGVAKYDAATGELLEIVDFVPGSADPHGLAMHNGTLISCDAGIHPGWPVGDSPASGYICRIDFI
jgi:hypothetical protein